jgi:hypothetical protein
MATATAVAKITKQTLVEEIAALRAQIEQMRDAQTVKEEQTVEKKAAVVEATTTLAKNHRPGKAHDGRTYMRLTAELANWGKVPAQQAAIAKIIVDNTELGKEYSETEVFDMLNEHASKFTCLSGSRQDVTYLFRYYRGLKRDATHAGFVARGFLKQSN